MGKVKRGFLVTIASAMLICSFSLAVSAQYIETVTDSFNQHYMYGMPGYPNGTMSWQTNVIEKTMTIPNGYRLVKLGDTVTKITSLPEILSNQYTEHHKCHYTTRKM